MFPCRAAAPEFAAAEGPSTPPPEDQEFEDDDGTVYQWDRKLRKFQPKGQASTGAEYRVEDMTFEMDEETIPALQMSKEAGFRHLYLSFGSHQANKSFGCMAFARPDSLIISCSVRDLVPVPKRLPIINNY